MTEQTTGAWNAWKQLEKAINQGQLLVIDGATGTEVERKGAAMNRHGWSCAAQLYAPEIVREVHQDYIDAGADIIIANTYATNRNVMAGAQLGDRTEEAIEIAIKLARDACNSNGHLDESGFKRPWVMGSLSTHPPSVKEGTDQAADGGYLPGPAEEAAYVEAATAIAQSTSGCDMLWLEMMKDLHHAPKAIRAAAQSGLPFFMGISTRISETGELYLFGTAGEFRDELRFTAEAFNSLVEVAGENLQGINIMHTNFSAMGPTLKAVRDFGWEGILGAYPDHGRFKMPHWEFEELDIEEAMEMVRGWVSGYGVSLIGGCCGLGPDFIAALKRLATTL